MQAIVWTINYFQIQELVSIFAIKIDFDAQQSLIDITNMVLCDIGTIYFCTSCTPYFQP